MTLWAIWNVRNKFYFEKAQSHPKDILNGAIGYLQEYQKGTTEHMKLAATNFDLIGFFFKMLVVFPPILAVAEQGILVTL